MKTTYIANTPIGVVDILQSLIKSNGPITVIEILPPGTPISEVSLAKTQEVTKSYIIKLDL